MSNDVPSRISPFERTRQVTEHGSESWSARDLSPYVIMNPREDTHDGTLKEDENDKDSLLFDAKNIRPGDR